MNQMVKIKEGKYFDALDVIRRSPVANTPGADRIMGEVLYRSIVYQGLIDDEVACVWGLIPPSLMSRTAYMWLLTTDIIVEHKFLFIRYSQLFVEDQLQKYELLVGDVIVPNPPAIRWLQWLGAEFTPAAGNRVSFAIRRKSWPIQLQPRLQG